MASQIRFHGGDPDTDLIAISPRPGATCIEEEDIEKAIEAHADELALVMIGGVHYFTGQLMDMQRIARAAHAVGAHCGFDLAHAMGNVPMQLHDWGVDFACWCSYKYLNSGPGAVAGAFIHEKHVSREDIPRFDGWWGHDAKRRFLMEPNFESMKTAEAWQMSNAPVLNMAVHAASLEMFLESRIDQLREKSKRLTAYMEAGIQHVAEEVGFRAELITPTAPERRGCQLSLAAHGFGKSLFEALTKAGVISDWREPNVIRMAPVPLYNTFEDIAAFLVILKDCTEALSTE